MNKVYSILAALTSLVLIQLQSFAQFSQPGELDTTFNFGRPHSFFTDPNNPFPGYGLNHDAVIHAIALQPDGKLIIGGDFNEYNGINLNRIARINSDGSLDGSFDQGDSGANGTIHSIILQPNGKVIIGGNFTLYNNTPRNRITRLNQNGSIDTTFNPLNGPGGFLQTIICLALQPDGKLLIGGDFISYNGITRNRIARLNIDGSLDTTFNPGMGADGRVESISLQPDGKMIIGGGFVNFNGTSRGRIARLNADGSLDISFNPGTGANNAVYSTILQSDGKVIIGGFFTSFNGLTTFNKIARLNTDGSRDFTFNPVSFVSDRIRSISLQPDGKILVCGNFGSGFSPTRVARLNTNGNFDPSFNTGSGADDIVRALSLLPDGKIIIAGDFNRYNGIDKQLARLTSEGSLDENFNPFTGANLSINDIAIQTDGNAIIIGDFDNYNGKLRKRITRLNEFGDLDSTFNSGSGANSSVRFTILQSDGKIIIGGDFDSYNGTLIKRIARLNANGSLDVTFNPGSGASSIVRTAAIQSDGKIVIAGGFSSYNNISRNRIARINADGSLDSTFNPGLGTGSNSSIHSVSLQPDGKIIIGGNFMSFNGTARNRIARLNPDGSLDMTFNPGIGANDIVNKTLVKPDGKIIIGGDFSVYNGITRYGIACLNGDGSLDVTFSPSTVANFKATAIKLQNDGKVLVGGYFWLNGDVRDTFFRLNNYGKLDTSFKSDTSDIGRLLGMAQTNNKLIIIGGIFRYNGIPRSRIARLFNSNCTTTITISTDTSVICAGISKSLTGTQGGSFVIASGPGSIIGNQYIANGGGGNVSIYNEVGGCTSPLVTFNVISPSNPVVNTPTAICSGNFTTIIPTSGGVSYRFYSSPTGGSPLVGGNGVTSFQTPILSSDTTYYVASVTAQGCESAIRTAVTITVRQLPLAPNVSTVSRCGPGSVAVVPSSGGVSYRFYSVSIGGSPLAGGNGVTSFTTPVLTASTTYHVASVNSFGCESNNRTAVTVTIHPFPSAPTVPTPSGLCPGNSATITPTAGGVSYRFYANSTGGSPLTGGNGVASYSTPNLSNTTTYHVASVSSQGCESNTRTPVSVTVNPLPPAPTVPAPTEICSGTNTSIIPSAGGSTYRFYSAATGGSPLAGGNGVLNYVTPILSSNTTYFVSSLSATGCESSTRTPVTVLVNLLPNVVVTIVNDTLRASIIIGAYQWLLNGVIIPGANSSLFVPTVSGNYSAQVTSPQGCVGVSAPVVFIVSGSETDLQNPSTVDVFPNPIGEELHVKSELDFDFVVTDILGNVVLKGQKLAGDQIISTERLASGSYFLQVISERGILNKKLIKQ